MSCRVLIVDDSPILRSAIKKVVMLSGIEQDQIFEAGDGRDALQVLETVWVDLVLLDLNMPVMNGEEFAEERMKRPGIRDIPIVIVSTEGNKARLDRMRELGVVESLHKPFEPEELCHLISKLLGVKI